MEGGWGPCQVAARCCQDARVYCTLGAFAPALLVLSSWWAWCTALPDGTRTAACPSIQPTRRHLSN